jgi:uncharacterized membrane protein SpoIIM required for sporulation
MLRTPMLRSLIPRSWSDSPGALLLEGGVVSLAAGVFALRMFPSEASLVAVGLAAMLTIDTVDRVATRPDGEPFSLTVRKLVLKLSALFLGATAGFAVLAAMSSPEQLALLFSNQLDGLPTGAVATWDFGSLDGILLSNAYVLAFFFLIAVGFRQGGVMLAVAWNASVWGAALGLALTQDMAGAQALGAMLPHLALEALAYITAGLAGVFLAKGTVRYLARGHGPWAELGKTVGLMLLAATLMMVLGACFEAWFTDWMLR